MKTLAFGAAALGLFWALRSRGEQAAPDTPAFVATGANGEEGGARWDVFRLDTGNWGYSLTARKAGESEFETIISDSEFALMSDAVDEAQMQAKRACMSKVYDCSGEPPPKTQAASIEP